MIRVAILDDHPALRAGLNTVLAAERDVVVAGAAANSEQLFPLVRRTAPDVVLLDYHLPDGDGLLLCRRIKQLLLPPRVLVYSAYANERLQVAAIVACADGLLHKRALARELLDAIRRVARGERVLGAPEPRVLEDAAREVDAQDAPLLAMLVADRPAREVASVMGVTPHELERRIARILARLRVETLTALP